MAGGHPSHHLRHEGAYGAALAAKDAGLTQSTLLSAEALASFTHEARPATCKLCTNHCSLTINRFDGGRKFISGNPLFPAPGPGEGGHSRPAEI